MPDTEPPSAPPHRPVSALAARRTDHGRPPARANRGHPPARPDGSLPDTEPPSAPPHRPVSAPAARRTDHAHPPARADGPRAPSHTGWTAHGEGRLAGTLPRGRTAGTLPRERTHRCPAPAGACAAPPAGECARRAADGPRAPSRASGRTAGALAHGVDGSRRG